MKKGFALALMLVLLCVSVALAEDTDVIEITFDGSYLEFEEYGFKVFLPNEWNVLDDDEVYFSVCNDDETEYMAIDVFEAGGEELMDIANMVAAEADYENVTALTINGIPFILYNAPEINAFGAFTITENNIYCIQFVFAPNNEAFMELATQIMASVEAM